MDFPDGSALRGTWVEDEMCGPGAYTDADDNITGACDSMICDRYVCQCVRCACAHALVCACVHVRAC